MSRTEVGNRVRVNFYFDRPVFEALRRIAAYKNTTYSEVLRVAAREYIVREAAQAAADHKTIMEIEK